MNTFIQQGYIKLFKSDSKDLYIVTKDFSNLISEGSCYTGDWCNGFEM